ncbi:potassium channel family protein [Bradyrhizobium sp. Tv2a-2]|uniref:potassium channel family protein n=1 Tax=Bradyrhizobium sp. Tv2a-2 TaxID=113395 RepID=UPI00040BD1A3|nr:potassium channel family protein [Bradyrhizobium sp. Tv2a-2]
MLRQIIFGSAISLVDISVHAVAMTVVIEAARATAARAPAFAVLRLIAVMIATVAVLMAAHLCEIGIWAAAYALVDAVPDGSDHFYFAFVNFTTLGYGDIVPVQRWRILGPMTAMDGVLLFGWSTAVIFAVLIQTLGRDPK